MNYHKGLNNMSKYQITDPKIIEFLDNVKLDEYHNECVFELAFNSILKTIDDLEHRTLHQGKPIAHVISNEAALARYILLLLSKSNQNTEVGK